MVNWQNTPPVDKQLAPYRLVRVNHVKPLKAVILSKTLIGVMLHYWKGRSRPCQNDRCEACKAGQKPRWKGYFQVANMENRTVCIVEITERVWHEFQAEEKKHGNLRGSKVELSRTNRRQNGPLAARFMAGRVPEADLMDETDVSEILERMWEITQTSFIDLSTDDTDEERGTLAMQA